MDKGAAGSGFDRGLSCAIEHAKARACGRDLVSELQVAAAAHGLRLDAEDVGDLVLGQLEDVAPVVKRMRRSSVQRAIRLIQRESVAP